MSSTGDIRITIIDCNGEPLAVITEQKPGESYEDFIARHEAKVAAEEEACESGQQAASSAAAWVSKSGKRELLVPGDGDAASDDFASRVERARSKSDGDG